MSAMSVPKSNLLMCLSRSLLGVNIPNADYCVGRTSYQSGIQFGPAETERVRTESLQFFDDISCKSIVEVDNASGRHRCYQTFLMRTLPCLNYFSIVRDLFDELHLAVAFAV